MSSIALVQKINEVVIEHAPGELFTVRAKARHNTGNRNPRLVPMHSEVPTVLRLGFYVEQLFTDQMSGATASLEFKGDQFAEVCVVSQTDHLCRPVFEA
jgi:hypothetical protein